MKKTSVGNGTASEMPYPFALSMAAPIQFDRMLAVSHRIFEQMGAINRLWLDTIQEANSSAADLSARVAKCGNAVEGGALWTDWVRERDKLNKDLREILDAQTDAWGIKVANVELKHVDLNETMVRAIAKQAEAERLRRAKVIDAEGELQAAEKLLQAGQILAKAPEAMQFRYFGTILNVAGERSSAIVLPVPMDLVQSLTALAGRGGNAERAAR